MSSEPPKYSFRQKLRTWSQSLRSHDGALPGQSSDNLSDNANPSAANNLIHKPPVPSTQTRDRLPPADNHSLPPTEVRAISDEDKVPNEDISSLLTSSSSQSQDASTPGAIASVDSIAFAPDLRTAAYKEAVKSLEKESDKALIQEQNIGHLFQQLENMSSEEYRNSAFEKGMQRLRRQQRLLRALGLGLDLVSPVTSIEPATSAAFGLVRGVITVAVTFAAADLEFASRVEDMIKQIEYIEGCDTLSQQAERKDIHKVLIPAYVKLIEFYIEAHRLLSKQGLKFVVTTLLQTQLPSIVEDFLKKVDILQKTIQNATLESVGVVEKVAYDQEINEWLRSSNMRQQSSYFVQMQDLCAREACDFLLAEPGFLDWYKSSNSKQLVLLGDMGSGKTMTMTFLVEELRERSAHQLRKPKICFYYCRDDGSGSADQIFSCLILSLLEQLPGLKKDFYEWIKEAKSLGHFDPGSDPKRLAEFLLRLLESTSHPVLFVIDGLDECDRASRGILLTCLQDVSSRTQQHKTILSSRPQQEILDQIGSIRAITVLRDAKRDRIIVRRTVEKQLFHLSKAVQTVVVARLSSLAKGSAIWTKMIIKLIEVRKIRALGPMQDFLSDLPLPEQLSELYNTIFSRCTEADRENDKIASTALRVLTAARRPLSILELGWATAVGTTEVEGNTIARLSQLVDHERVLDLIYPFITQLNFKDVKAPQIQLTHQSVKEFVVAGPKDWPCLQSLATMAVTDYAPLNQQPTTLESLLLSICVRYLNFNEINQNHIFSPADLAIEALPQDVDLFNDTDQPQQALSESSETWETWEAGMVRYDPAKRGFGELFAYASTFWIQHFGALTTEPLPKLSVIESVCQAGSTRLHNWTQQNRRPDCIILPRFEFDSTEYDPLGITSIYGPERFFQEILDKADLSKGYYLQDSIPEAADQILQWGDLSRIKLLLDSKYGYQLHNLRFYRLIIERRSSRVYPCGSWEPLYNHIDYALGSMVKEEWGHKLLCIAASAGCMPIIERLILKAQENEELRHELVGNYTSHGHRRNALREAVRIGHQEMCRFLVRTGGLDPWSALTMEASGQITLKDKTHQNDENWAEILGILCEGIE